MERFAQRSRHLGADCVFRLFFRSDRRGCGIHHEPGVASCRDRGRGRDGSKMYLDEAAFEIHEIGTLAESCRNDCAGRRKAAKVPENRIQCGLIRESAGRGCRGFGRGAHPCGSGRRRCRVRRVRRAIARKRRRREAAGRNAARTSQDDITRTCRKAVWFCVGVSLLGLLVGSTMSYTLARAILTAIAS